jgi:PAS domain S-box-containing protein
MREHLHSEVQSARYVVFVDADRRYTDCSDGVIELLGYDRSELLDMKIDDLSFDTSCVPNLFEKYRQERLQNGEFLLRHKNGTPILIHYDSWVFEDGCHAAAWNPAEEWEQLYLAALIEINSDKLKDKARIAMTAIRKRQSTSGAGENPDILQRLRDADEAVRSLLS